MTEYKRALIVISFISALALSFLVWLIYFGVTPTYQVSWVNKLPALNALLNTLSATSLLCGYIFIKNSKVQLHKKAMFTAMLFSALFLVSYITYHYFHGDTKFLGTGLVRVTYFVILISHILLSIIALPMVLITFYLGIKDIKDKHKQWAKWTFPIWLYVSVTGVLIFVFLTLYN